jgi:tRNA pseudouridine38-40 synthase
VETYKIVLAYDGTDFHGWQRQPENRTVQGVVEAALLRITGKRTAVIGSGRTDAGVHARAQVASFRAALKLGLGELLRALNAVLEDDVRILSLERCEAGWNARRAATSRTYQYRIVNSPLVHPFDFRYALHWPYPLNLRAMRAGARLLVRTANFDPFSSNRDLNPVRTVARSEICKRSTEILYTIEANGFLRAMVRTIVGTLLEIGRGKYPPERIEEIFTKKERALAGPTAPARGLCLIRVTY